jgi:hypothetical protein
MCDQVTGNESKLAYRTVELEIHCSGFRVTLNRRGEALSIVELQNCRNPRVVK